MVADAVESFSDFEVVFGVGVGGDDFCGSGFGPVGLVLEYPEITSLYCWHGICAGTDSGVGSREDFDCEIEVVFAFAHFSIIIPRSGQSQF